MPTGIYQRSHKQIEQIGSLGKSNKGKSPWTKNKKCLQVSINIKNYIKRHPNFGFQKGNILGFQKGHHPETEFKKGHSKSKNAYVFPKGHHSKTEFKKGHKLNQLDKNPNWKDGISFEPYTTDWTEDLKESIRKRDDYVCQICGIHQDELKGFNRKLDVHHIDYNKKNLNPKNLISLCRSCHMKTNHNREYWIKYFNKQ